MNEYKAREYARYDNENQGLFGWSFGLALVIMLAMIAIAVVAVFAVFYVLLTYVTRWISGPDPELIVGDEDRDADHVKARIDGEAGECVPADEITPWRWWQH